MGCDGGTIPRRDELVKTAKKPEQKDKDAERQYRWLHCALTQQRLKEPIVMCGLGRLYSKQDVIEQLLEKDKMPESCKHIKNMRDIKQLNLTKNPAYVDEDKNEGSYDGRHAPYICKLMGLEMAGKFGFRALWSCGCVMSERALREIKSTNSICPLCQTPYSIEDVIILNGNEEEVDLMVAKMEMRSNKRKEEKKSKKEKKVDVKKEDIKKETDAGPSTSKVIGVKNGAVTVNGKIKLVPSVKRQANKISLEDPEIKRLREEYSVAKDPKASDVYKSLFTTHKSEKEQQRAHWITYNPFYN